MVRGAVHGRICRSYSCQRPWISRKVHLLSTNRNNTVNGPRYLSFPSTKTLFTRCISRATSARNHSTDVESSRQLVYEGPLSRSVQLVKVFSLSTALATMVATPILMIYGKQTVPLAGKFAIGATIILAGTSTTFLLHWVTKVYVHRMFYNAATEMFTVETMNLLARRKETEFSLDEIRLAKEPTAFTTFQAKEKKYFLHTDLLEAQQVLQFIRENRS